VMAVSGGGITALQMELDYPGTVRRLVLCVAASQAGEYARRELLRIVDLEDEGRSSARAGTRLIAHGPRVVPPELLRATASGITGARLLLLPGRGHASALYDPRLKPAIAAFLAQPV
jgi:pimeloyl-ACP methyl ester carboxylesterase